jgi:predicted HAD superfamily Cof-like phosphohydrolase
MKQEWIAFDQLCRTHALCIPRYDALIGLVAALSQETAMSLDHCFDEVATFHQNFGIPVSTYPEPISAIRVGSRSKWLLEEVEEFRSASSLNEQADAMIDIIYLALGGLVEMGVRPQALFQIVHESNMSNRETLDFPARESSTVEFKESFNWGSKDKYAKAMAAFANHRGGCLVFGVADQPRRLVGLASAGFESLDEATITGYLNGIFSPEICYSKFSVEVAGRRVGIICVEAQKDSPVAAIKNDGEIREAEIYYRYNARNDKIKYPELTALFEHVRDRERKNWMDLFKRVSKIGPGNAGILDVVHGTIEGDKGSLLIDAALLPKLRFIKQGSLADSGRPVLKLIGDVRPIAMAGRRAGGMSLRITDDPLAPAVREETLLEQYPLTYQSLLKLLGRRYTDFKQNNSFHDIRRPLKKNPRYCHTRYLDPKTKKAGQDFYSEGIFDEFDKHYTRR